jgi:uncharacterized protein
MHFAIIAYDKPGHLALRLAERDKHRAYLQGAIAEEGATVVFGGPLLDGAGVDPVGSLVVLEASSLEAAKAAAAKDPYVLAGLFATFDVVPWRFAIGNSQAGV